MAINVTPDGFCDHRYGIADDELHEFFSNLLKTADTELFGRKTFQLMEAYWPNAAENNIGTKAEIEFAKLFNEIHKIVFSKAGITTSWKNTTVLSEINAEEIIKLKQKPGKDIHTGSPSIVNQLASLGLIDEYYYLIHPVIAGNGKRFFESDHLSNQINLSLLDTKIFKSGVIALHYQTKN
jgi:dihydrofolate reductase